MQQPKPTDQLVVAKALATSLFDDGILFHVDQLGLIFFLGFSPTGTGLTGNTPLGSGNFWIIFDIA